MSINIPSDGRDIVLKVYTQTLDPSPSRIWITGGYSRYYISNFADLSYEASKTTITGTLAEGTLV